MKQSEIRDYVCDAICKYKNDIRMEYPKEDAEEILKVDYCIACKVHYLKDEPPETAKQLKRITEELKEVNKNLRSLKK